MGPIHGVWLPHPRIFLIGYRGTGKSTVAEILASRIGWQAVDLDGLIEGESGCTIRHIFDREGEQGFRYRESEVLKRICGQEQKIVATGGGIVLAQENRELLQKDAWVIWLTGEPRTLWERIQKDTTTENRRPILTVGGLEEVEQLLNVREPLYRECASWTVATDHRSPEEVASHILAHWTLS